jgi:hypothetical protein
MLFAKTVAGAKRQIGVKPLSDDRPARERVSRRRP